MSTKARVIELLWDYLKKDSKHKDRRQTGWGTKTQDGLVACIEEITALPQTATATESSKGPIQVFNDRELATVLHALRRIQEHRCEVENGCEAADDLDPQGGSSCEHFDEVSPLNNDEIDALCERLNLAPEKPQADPLLLTAEAYRDGQIETLKAKCDCGQHLYGIHRVHWCNEAATKRKVLIQVEDGVAEVMECPDDVDVTIDDKDGQDEPMEWDCPACGREYAADMAHESRAAYAVTGRCFEGCSGTLKPLSADVIAARAGIIPHDPQDDESDEEDVETATDVNEAEDCSVEGCNVAVHPEDPYFATPCGTYCTEHMREHVKGCEICRNEFPAAAENHEREAYDPHECKRCGRNLDDDMTEDQRNGLPCPECGAGKESEAPEPGCNHIPHDADVMQTVCEKCGAELFYDAAGDTWGTAAAV